MGSLKYIFLLLAILLIVVPAGAWYNANWLERQPLYVQGRSSDSANNSVYAYPVYLQVYNITGTSSGEIVYLPNLSSKDYRDLRIVASDDTTVLKVCPNTSALDPVVGGKWTDHIDIWFRANELVKDKKMLFYVYLHNDAATADWDCESTFLLHDHFPGSSPNTTKWMATGSSVTGSIITSVAGDYLTSNQTFGVNTSIYARAQYTLASKTVYFGYQNQSPDNRIIWDYWDWATAILGWNRAGGDSVSASKSGTAFVGVYQILEVKRNSTTATIYSMNNSAYEVAITTNVPTSLENLTHYSGSTGVWKADLELVKKYLYPEPYAPTWAIREFPIVAPPTAAFSCVKTGTSQRALIRNESVTCTDTSATSTSWDYYGNGPNPCFTGNATNQNPVIFPRNFGYCSLCEIATNTGGSDTECKPNYLYIMQPGVQL